MDFDFTQPNYLRVEARSVGTLIKLQFPYGLKIQLGWFAPQTPYVHLVQNRGQQGQPSITLNLKPGNQRSVEVDFLYSPDATPPQILTIKTLGN